MYLFFKTEIYKMQEESLSNKGFKQTGDWYKLKKLNCTVLREWEAMRVHFSGTGNMAVKILYNQAIHGCLEA